MNKKIVSNAINGLCDVRVILIIVCGFLMVAGCVTPVTPVIPVILDTDTSVDTRDPGLAGKTVRVEEGGEEIADIVVAEDGSWQYQDLITENHIQGLRDDGSVEVGGKTFTIVYPSTH